MCGGGGAPPPPPIDPAAQELERKQIALLDEQARQQQSFQPLYAAEYGYEPIYGEDPVQRKLLDQLGEIRKRTNTFNKPDVPEAIAVGKQLEAAGFKGDVPDQIIVGYRKSASRAEQDRSVAELQSAQMATAKRANDALNKYLDTLDTEDYQKYLKAQQEVQAQQARIALQQGERTEKALKGELPLSEGTIQRKAADFQLLKENLAKSGNAIIGDDPSTAYSLSSPGTQALKEFNSRYSAIEGQERQGALDSGTLAYLQAVGLTGNIGKSDLGTLGGLSNPGGYAATSTSLTPGASPIQNNLNLVQGYTTALNPYLQAQEMQWKTGAQNADIAAQNRAGWLNLAGTAIGTAGGLAALKASNRRFKKNIEPIRSEQDATRALAKTPVYRWNYKDEPDGHKKHLGTMTDEAPADVVTEDGDYLDVTSYMGLLTLSTKDLHNRVLSLEGRRG